MIGDIDKMINNVICGDCTKIMKEFPDKSIDLILTDPPYGIGYDYDVYNDTKNNLQKLIKCFMPNALRVAKNVVLTPGITNIGKYPEPYWMMAWYYKGGANRGKWGFNCWQPILLYGKDPYLVNLKGARSDVIEDNKPPEKWEHSCPKPITFWEKLLLRCSVKESDLVLDPFMGSGTTGIVCKKNKRNWIGIDISESYCNLARKRINGTEKPLI